MGVPNNVIDRSQQLLSRLNEIKIRSFPNEFDDNNTPSSGSCCLPTPVGDASLGLPPPPPVQATEATTSQLGLAFTSDAELPPRAPVMKDYDSFTDGTGHGSFDSIPIADTDLDGQPFIPITDIQLAAYPPQSEQSMRLTIELWREDVSVNTPVPRATPAAADSSILSPAVPHTKRPRSNASDDDVLNEERNRRTKVHVRTRAQSMSSVSSAMNSFAWDFPVDELPHARPPSVVAVG